MNLIKQKDSNFELKRTSKRVKKRGRNLLVEK